MDKVKTWPVPKNIKEVQSFLGLASYYRHFIPHLAKKAQCLHEVIGPTASKPKIEPKPGLKRLKLLAIDQRNQRLKHLNG